MLITCQECMARIYPEDPSIRVGKYHLSTCEHYCDKPTYYRDLEVRPAPQVIEHRHSDMSKQDFARLLNLEGQVKYLQGRYRTIAFGCDANAFPGVLQVYVDADNAGVLKATQAHIAETARTLFKSLEHVAMIALVDEATDYQSVRPHQELR